MNSKPHITYLTVARMPTEKAHGVSIAHMCASFAAEGADVELVIPTRRNAITEDIFSYYGVPKTFSVRTIPVMDLVGRGFTHPFFFFLQRLLFVRAARRVGIAPGVVYTREPEIAGVFAKTHETVYEVHRLPRGFWGTLTGALIRHASLVVCNSRGTESAARTLGATHTVVAPNGFDPILFKGALPERAELGLPEGPLALYMGSDAAWKGADVVRAAAKLVADGLTLVMVGGSKKAQSGHLVELGHVAPRDVAAYLRNADILILPNTNISEESERFTSPIKLFEYLAAGKAIVASDLPSIREILEPNDAFFIPPGDAEALAHALKTLATDESLRLRLAERARAKATQYTWDARAKRVLGALATSGGSSRFTQL